MCNMTGFYHYFYVQAPYGFEQYHVNSLDDYLNASYHCLFLRYHFTDNNFV